MTRSYLLVALRNLLKRKGYSAIKVVGLSVGLAAVILIFLYTRHELSYDRFHEQGERIFPVYKERVTPTGTQITRDTWVPLAERLELEYPAVENSVRMWTQSGWVRHEENRFEEQITYADPSLLEVFTFPLTTGDLATALADPNSAIVSTSVASFHEDAELKFDSDHVVVVPVEAFDFDDPEAGGSALLIDFVTVSLMALRAALTDPVQTLRYE